MKRVLVGKIVNPNQLMRGRFTKKKVNEIYKLTLSNLQNHLVEIEFTNFQTNGNRLMVFLAAASVACYQAILSEKVPEEWAKQLFSEVGWDVYAKLSSPYIAFAKIRFRHPQEQLNLFINMLCKFPFSQDKNGYQYRVWKEENKLCTDWFQCAPLNYIKSLDNPDLLEMFKESWCKYDFALPQLLNENGRYERPSTLSHGGEVCNMRWYSDKNDIDDLKLT